MTYPKNHEQYQKYAFVSPTYTKKNKNKEKTFKERTKRRKNKKDEYQ